jgi:hypothetical protein
VETKTHLLNTALAVNFFLKIDDNVTNSSSLKAFLPPGETCKSNSSANYSVAYNLICNHNQTSPYFDASSFDINKCYNEITITSKDGK